jgi:hypothetical protein
MELTKEELSILLKLVCDDAQKEANRGKSPSKEMYDLRYKITDLIKIKNED